ncbi:MAG: Stk1 family PASTA domain-containing Ser/Thr kinase [Clostridia bacterium]|nr:Stk1 family PASTA domain-containing Ser/Thr kinase [Clostridia bacterium]
MNIEGRIIGNRYEIIEKVGSGGMATVYKARDTILNRYVAVKVLRDEFTTDEEFIKRFNTEAQSAARLTHPNIVSVFDVGQEYNIYYIVMELIQGKTLKQIISEEGALPWKWTVNIAIQICSALEMAHKNGIIHRDIKPHNIIITEDGIAKVTDFGIAKAVSNSTITAFGTTIGSVHYFSPEHARGGYTDAKSDIYSLGVVMYEMITGRVPFDADTPVSVALKHMQEEPIEPAKLNSRVPEAVNQIILKAMKKDTSARYGSATEMMKDLSLALKNPTGTFVEQANTGDFTKVIPTISENIVSEDKYKSNRQNQTRVSRDTAKIEPEKKSGLAKYLEENPKMKPVVYIGFGLLILLIAALVFWGSWKLTNKLLGTDKDTSQQSGISLPSVTSLTADEAKKKLDDLGVKYEIIEEYSDEVEEGKVIRQDMDAGTNYDVNKTRAVKIYVSKGVKMVTVPKVKGLTLEEATEELKKVELEVKEEKEESQTVEEGIVIRQDAEEGKEVIAGSKITLYVSSGPKKVAVTDVINETEDKAKEILTKGSLEVDVTYAEDTSKSNGVVLKQSIEGGSVVEVGTKITITVNKIQENVQGTININVKSLANKYLSEENDTSKTESDKTDSNKAGSNTAKGNTNSTVDIRVLVGNDTIYSKSVARNTENLNVTFEAKGNVQIKVYINDILANGKSYSMDLNSSNTVLNID